MKKTVVLISNRNNYLNSIKYSFKNVIELNDDMSSNERDELVKQIEKYERIILVDYLFVFRYLMQNLNKEFDFLITYDIANLSYVTGKWPYKTMQEYYDRKLVNEVAFIDEDFYQVFKKAGYKTKQILLDVNLKFKKQNNNSIGIIGIDYNPLDNYYNALTAVKLISYDFVNISGKTNATKEFVGFFDMKYKEFDKELDVIKNSDIVLYPAFSTISIEKVLICMDNDIPILLGNTNIFDKYKTLKKYLVLESDDDVSEIANKINLIRENKKEIFDEYKNFRKKYQEEYKKLMEKFNS